MRYQPRDAEIVWEKMEDESLLIDLRSGVYYSFQKSYAPLVDRLLEGWSREELLQNVPLPSQPQVESALSRLLDFLTNEGLLVEGADKPAGELQLLDTDPLEFPEPEKYEDLQEIFEMDPIHEGDLEKGWPVAR